MRLPGPDHDPRVTCPTCGESVMAYFAQAHMIGHKHEGETWDNEDPRPPARVVDIGALRRFRLEHLGEPCDNECGRFGQHVHHKVFRSQGGGDVPENLAWLCHICHSAEHGIRVVP